MARFGQDAVPQLRRGTAVVERFQLGAYLLYLRKLPPAIGAFANMALNIGPQALGELAVTNAFSSVLFWCRLALRFLYTYPRAARGGVQRRLKVWIHRSKRDAESFAHSL